MYVCLPEILYNYTMGYIVMLTSCESIQFLLVAERKVLTSTDSFIEILTALVAAYFTFN